MATFTVNTTADVVDGNYSLLSLREAVNRANSTIAGDTIVFAGSLEGQTLVLTGGQLTLSQDITIDGDQNNDGVEVTLSGGDSSRILRSSGSGTDLALQDLTLTDGRVGSGAQGGGVFVGGGGSLALADCTIRDCRSGVYDAPAGNGGGIFAEGGSRVIVAGSRVEGNYASASGGGIAATEGNVALVVRDSHFAGNIARGYGLSGGAIHVGGNSSLVIEDSSLAGNHAYLGGALAIYGSTATIARSTISGNSAHYVGGILTSSSSVTLNDSTIVGNSGSGYFGGIEADGGELVVRNATITGNDSQSGDGQGGGIVVSPSTRLDIANSIIAGNSASPYQSGVVDPDISGAITASNGHNIFGSDVLGNNPGDRENIAASAIFANIDPETGGGRLNAVGIVPLLNNINNPALSGADPLAAGATGQTGDSSRPLPVGSLPDIGSIEISHALSTTASARNDVLTGTAAANTINAVAGNDYLKGLGSKDTLNGGDGSDLLDGGIGNDKLNGGGGIDLVFYGGATKVTFDLAATTDTAKRGSETDTLTGVEGEIGSSAADVFKGNEFNNYFQGGLGKDTFSGGSGRDLYDINGTAESGVGSTLRDIIADFDHLVDDIDLMGLDANTAVSGNQAFRWLGATPLSGAGQVGFSTSSGNTFIRGSNDADAASEFEIQLTGLKALTVDDFYL